MMHWLSIYYIFDISFSQQHLLEVPLTPTSQEKLEWISLMKGVFAWCHLSYWWIPLIHKMDAEKLICMVRVNANLYTYINDQHLNSCLRKFTRNADGMIWKSPFYIYSNLCLDRITRWNELSYFHFSKFIYKFCQNDIISSSVKIRINLFYIIVHAD